MGTSAALSAGIFVALSLMGFGIAQLTVRGHSRCWAASCLSALGLLAILLSTWHVRRLHFVPPFSWMMSRNNELGLFAVLVPWTLGVLATRTRQRLLSFLLPILAGCAVLRISILPTVSQAMLTVAETTPQTQFDAHGVCLQSTEYSCGPAAAVTALRTLGVAVEEQEMILLCRTTRLTATPDDVLARVLREHFANEGVVVRHGYCRSIDELRKYPVAIVVMRFGLGIDHYVSVLGFEGSNLLIGDPLTGWKRIPADQFEEEWRNIAIMLARNR